MALNTSEHSLSEWREATACPACGSIEYVQIGKVATAFEVAAGGRSFRQPEYVMRYCSQCSLYYKSHSISLKQLEEYYSILECGTFDIDQNFPTDRILHERLSELPIGSRVLDFGCSTGRVLRPFAAKHDCMGVEANKAAAAIASVRGIKVVSIEDLNAKGAEKFDAILLVDVYEHLPHPVEVVAMLASLLKPGGWLAIVTGNGDSIRMRERIGEFWYFRILGHLFMIGEAHISWLAAVVGLKVDAIHRCSHYSLPVGQRLRQFCQTWAYCGFHGLPTRIGAIARRIPMVWRVGRWTSAPALTCTADHFVAFLNKVPK